MINASSGTPNFSGTTTPTTPVSPVVPPTSTSSVVTSSSNSVPPKTVSSVTTTVGATPTTVVTAPTGVTSPLVRPAVGGIPVTTTTVKVSAPGADAMGAGTGSGGAGSGLGAGTQPPASFTTTSSFSNIGGAVPTKKKGGFNLKWALLGIFMVLLVAGLGVAFYLSQQTQNIQPNACISCGGGSCPDGFSYGADNCAPQATCGQRDAEACAGHGGGGGGGCSGASNCSTTCADGTSFSDACPASGAFGSCGQWATEACGSHGGVGGGGGGGGNTGTCSTTSQYGSATSCAGVAVNGPCIGSGSSSNYTCQRVQTETQTGYSSCGCVVNPGVTNQPNGSPCSTNSNCSSNNCSNNVCAAAGTGGGASCNIDGIVVPANSSVCSESVILLTCTNGSPFTTDCSQQGRICSGNQCITQGVDTSKCYDGAPTALSCRGGVAVGTRVAGGTCRLTSNDGPGGASLCAFIPDTLVGDNGSCTDDSNCSSGFCRKTSTPFACRPASERPGSGGSCIVAGASCNTGTCCNGSVCQGTQGSRICQAQDTAFCGTGTCTGYYSFQCTSLNSSSNGVPICSNNPRFHGTDQAAAAARAGTCGQWDQVCVGGPKNGQLCGAFAIFNQSCGVTPPAPTPPASNPPPVTPTPGPQCLSIAMSNITRPNALVTADPILGDAVRFTCGTVPGAAKYIFKVTPPTGAPITLQATGAVSAPYTIAQSGKFYAQCQICTTTSDSGCFAYEQISTTQPQ